jgi:hypothetical protein
MTYYLLFHGRKISTFSHTLVVTHHTTECHSLQYHNKNYWHQNLTNISTLPHPVTQEPQVGQGLLVIEGSRSNSYTHTTLGSDQPVAETSA